jgi:hypothetical protein
LSDTPSHASSATQLLPRGLDGEIDGEGC